MRTVTPHALLERLQIGDVNPGACSGPGSWLDDTSAPELTSYNPTTGELIARVRQASPEAYERVLGAATGAFARWRMVPAPRRGEVIRDLGSALREAQELAAVKIKLAELQLSLASPLRPEPDEVAEPAPAKVALPPPFPGTTPERVAKLVKGLKQDPPYPAAADKIEAAADGPVPMVGGNEPSTPPPSPMSAPKQVGQHVCRRRCSVL